MRLILIRHGESEMNALNKQRKIFNGQAETPLTSLGRQQAIEVGKRLATMPQFRAELAVSSTIQRSIDTARIVLEQLPNSVPLHFSDGLRERSLGDFENRFADEVFMEFPQYRDDPAFKYFRGHFTQKAPGGENLMEVTLRAWKALKEFDEQCNGDLLFFSHSTTIRCLIGKALELPETEISDLKIPNASPIILKMENGKYSLDSSMETNVP